MQLRITSNADEVAADLVTVGGRAVVEAGQITRMYGQLLLTKVKANASSATHAPGAPHIGGYQGEGPNVATGNYRRSWGLEMEFSGEGPTAHVGTNAPQGRRLELGFVGEDSTGAHYDQPPLPHAGPAFDAVAPEYEAAMVAMLARLAT